MVLAGLFLTFFSLLLSACAVFCTSLNTLSQRHHQHGWQAQLWPARGLLPSPPTTNILPFTPTTSGKMIPLQVYLKWSQRWYFDNGNFYSEMIGKTVLHVHLAEFLWNNWEFSLIVLGGHIALLAFVITDRQLFAVYSNCIFFSYNPFPRLIFFFGWLGFFVGFFFFCYKLKKWWGKA